MHDPKLETICSSLQANLSQGEAKILEGLDGPQIVLVIPHRSEGVRKRIAEAARSRLPLHLRPSVPMPTIVQSEASWINFFVDYFVRNAFYGVRCAEDLSSEIRVSRTNDTLHVKILNDNCRSPETARKFEKAALSEKAKLLKIAGTNTVSVSALPFPRKYSQEFIQPGIEEEDDDENYDANPNWPSKTGNPSGGGRGNNPPGTRR